MKWLKRSAGILGLLVVMVALVPFFVTLDDYIPEFEKEISARLRQPVSIDSLQASMLPFPLVTIDGIAIGAAEEIKVSKLTFTPDIWSLFSAHKVIRNVSVNGLALSHQAVGTLVALSELESGPGAWQVNNIKVQAAVLKLEGASFGPFDASVQMGNSEQTGRLSLVTQDGTLTANVTPQGEAYLLDITARSWTLPFGPAIVFDELSIKGTATGTGAELSDIKAGLYGGTASGNALLGWDERVTLKGKFDLSRVELEATGSLLPRPARLTGKLDAGLAFSASADRLSALDDALRLESPFTVRHGIMHGLDIGSVAASPARQGVSGGQTRFDELSGHLATEGGTHRYTRLRMSSAALSARGHVTVSPAQALSGQLTASVKAADALASVSLAVAGTLDAPMLYPGTSGPAGPVAR